MNKFIKIISILALLCPFYIGSMEQKTANTQNSPFQKLHSNHIQNIILNAGSSDEIGECARQLSHVNKEFYKTIQNITPALIKNAPLHTPTSEAQAALAIRSKAARPWLQRNLTDENFKELQIFLHEHLQNRNASPEELAKVRFLLRSLPRMADCGSCPALLLAGDNLAIVKNLLAAGIYVDPIDDNHWSPLEAACRLNNYELAQILLNAGAKISSTCFTALERNEITLQNQEWEWIGGHNDGPRMEIKADSHESLTNIRTLLRISKIKQNCSIQ